MRLHKIRNIILQLAVICCIYDCHAADSLRQPRQPNIVVLIADDLGYGETGCQGNSEIPTPHIDSIAARGVRFTNGYVTAAFCSASRAGLLTGRYQTRFGYEFNPIGARNEDPTIGLPLTEITLSEHLRDAGYATALIGKWHLGGTAKFHPQRRGFDEFFGFLHEGHYFVPPPYDGVSTWLRRKSLPGGGQGLWSARGGRLMISTHMNSNEPDYDANNPILRSSQPVNEPLYFTDAITREAVSFINRTADRPFLMTVAYNAVHSPMQGADGYMQKFAHLVDVQRQIFAAMLGNMDDSVGEILSALAKNDLDKNTLVVFISDNGGPTRELTSNNYPLRGEKGSLYEGGIRVPFLMSWPGKIPANQQYDQPVISLDIFATACAAAGIELPVKNPFDGINLLPHLNGEESSPPHDALFWRTGNRAALRRGECKLVRNSGRAEESDWQLFHLPNDLSEMTDLSPTESAVRDDLIAKWTQMNSEMIEPLFKP